MCYVTIRVDFRNLGRDKVSRLQGEKARLRKMFIDSQGFNLPSYKPRSTNDSAQLLPRSTQPFPFLLKLDTDLTSSEKKNFSSWLQTKERKFNTCKAILLPC